MRLMSSTSGAQLNLTLLSLVEFLGHCMWANHLATFPLTLAYQPEWRLLWVDSRKYHTASRCAASVLVQNEYSTCLDLRNSEIFLCFISIAE